MNPADREAVARELVELLDRIDEAERRKEGRDGT